MPVTNASLSAPTVVFNGVAIASDPSVVMVNGEYLMFYTDLNHEGVATGISVARSSDGITWTRVVAPGDPGGAVLAGAHSYETANAVVINGELIIYVAEYIESAAGGLQSSIFAYRVNPDFSVEPVSSDPVIAPEAGGADEDAAFSPTVFAYDGGYVMYYVGHDYFEGDSSGVTLLYATSPDGITWTKGTTPILQAGDGPSWSAEGFAEPAVVIGPDGRVHLFYTSIDGENRAIGYAVADAPGMPFDFAPTPILTAADCPGGPTQILAPSAIIENGELRLWFFAYDDATGYRIMGSFGPFPEGATAETNDVLLEDMVPVDIVTGETAPEPRLVCTMEADFLKGTLGINTTPKPAGSDKLNGGDANDRLQGRDGDATLSGGAGHDLTHGGAGNDVFVFDNAARIGHFDKVSGFAVTGEILEEILEEFLRPDSEAFHGFSTGPLSPVTFETNETGLASTATLWVWHGADRDQLFLDADRSVTEAAAHLATPPVDLTDTQGDFFIF